MDKRREQILNAQGIAGNITSVCFIIPSSFGSSVTTMVSMNVGAGQGDKALHINTYSAIPEKESGTSALQVGE